jgi:pantoate--beta-alanine ligase
MVADLNFPLKIVVAPTCREPDGLAMSSRNQYLTPEQRPQAVCLWEAIQRAQQAVRAARRPVAAEKLRTILRRQIESRPAARVDYVEFFNPDTLQSVVTVKRGDQVALAVYVGMTRLIDNAAL